MAATSCTQEDIDSGINYTPFAISEEEFVIDAGPWDNVSTYDWQIEIRSSDSWEVESWPDNVSLISPSSSSYYLTKPVVTFMENPTVETITGEIIFLVSTGERVSIPVYQYSILGEVAVAGGDNKCNLTSDAGDFQEFTINSNLTELFTKIADTDGSEPSWLKAEIVKSASEDYKFNLTITTTEENTATITRSATVTVYGEDSYGEVAVTIDVTQFYPFTTLSSTLTNDDSGVSYEWTPDSNIGYYRLCINDLDGLLLYDEEIDSTNTTVDLTQMECITDGQSFEIYVEGREDASSDTNSGRTVSAYGNTLFAGGKGTSASPYTISCGRHLGNIAAEDYLSLYYEQTKDVTLSDVSSGESNVTMIGSSSVPFSGTYDGGGYSILNLQIECDDVYVGLFSYIDIATIKNLNVVVDHVLGGENSQLVGGIAGWASASTLSGCSVAGEDEDSIIYCAGDNAGAAATATTRAFAGGLIGGGGRTAGTQSDGLATTSAHNTVTSCINYCTVIAKITAGGIYGGLINGPFGPTITYCQNHGDVYQGNCAETLPGGVDLGDSAYSSNQFYKAAGIIGWFYGSSNAVGMTLVDQCLNTGSIYAETQAGGIVGQSTFGTVSNCYNDGTVALCRKTLSGSVVPRLGGIIAHTGGNTNVLISSYNVGDLINNSGNASAIIGGVVGYRQGAAAGNSYATYCRCLNTTEIFGYNQVDGVEGYAANYVGNAAVSEAALKATENLPDAFTSTGYWTEPSGNYPYVQLVNNPYNPE